ncbi:MAG: hypothetical protein EOP46_16355 [Sphingobacteriaceae bacterium]|nr:MAG: hypothetical protein EOP46_16355 [Sphingobacteriaceae bacterium]
MEKFQIICFGLALLTGISGVSKLSQLNLSPQGSKLTDKETDRLLIGMANLFFTLIAIACIFLKF